MRRIEHPREGVHRWEDPSKWLWLRRPGRVSSRFGAGMAESGQSAGPGAASLRSGREESAFEDAELSALGHGHGYVNKLAISESGRWADGGGGGVISLGCALHMTERTCAEQLCWYHARKGRGYPWCSTFELGNA